MVFPIVNNSLLKIFRLREPNIWTSESYTHESVLWNSIPKFQLLYLYRLMLFFLPGKMYQEKMYQIRLVGKKNSEWKKEGSCEKERRKKKWKQDSLAMHFGTRRRMVTLYFCVCAHVCIRVYFQWAGLWSAAKTVVRWLLLKVHCPKSILVTILTSNAWEDTGPIWCLSYPSGGAPLIPGHYVSW